MKALMSIFESNIVKKTLRRKNLSFKNNKKKTAKTLERIIEKNSKIN